MNRKTLTLSIVVAVTSALATLVLVRAFDPDQDDSHQSDVHAEHAEGEDEHGPNGGRLLKDGDFAIEVAIVESGIPPEFRIHAYRNGKLLAPDSVSVAIELGRLGGVREPFSFVPEGDYLRAIGVVREPHSFKVDISATHAGNDYDWSYESYEGRTQIPERVALASGIETETAGPHRIFETVELTGVVQADPARISRVRARFAGIATKVVHDTGDHVKRGDTLGLVETNESLQSIPVEAPISGLVVSRNIQVGQVTADEPLFVIVDLEKVWVQLDVFGRDLGAIRAGQQVKVLSLDGTGFDGTIDYVSPLVAHASQSVRARIPLDNSDGALRAGQFVRARVTVAEAEAPLAIRRSGLQTFRDFDVVYAKVGETYEMRMLKLGRQDEVFVEVLDGLVAGETYVVRNSYLVKADIEKSGATHDH